jgi:hypothetical protein
MDRARQPLVVALVILATAALLTLPAALGPVRYNDSFWIDWVWLDQFARELGNGVLYPRWLPLSHAGLGSPVFYYYPPLAFYAGSTFVLAGLPTYAALLATFLLCYALSGAAMYYWLRPWAQKPLLGAFVFMIAPYHTFNFYSRGAIAEFMATIFIPIVMAGLWLLKHKRGGGFAVTALAYAGLIATHLPLALLVSTFLLAPLLLMESYKSPRVGVPAALALATGVALAAIYWLPALLLEPYRDSAKLWADPHLRPSNWTFWHAGFRPVYLAILVIAAAIAIPLASLIARHRSRWAAYGFLCVLLAIGTVPVLWALPLLRSVQFPFRLLPVAEFALATGMACVAWRPATLVVALAPLLAISALIIGTSPADQGVTLADVRERYVDVPENLPRGERPYSWPSRWALAVAATHRLPQLANGVTTEPVFYFPGWQVRCNGAAVPTFPAPDTKLLSYPGRGCTRALALTAAEKMGGAVSVLGLLGLLAGAAIGQTGRLRRVPPRRKGGR